MYMYHPCLPLSYFLVVDFESKSLYVSIYFASDIDVKCEVLVVPIHVSTSVGNSLMDD